jgi:alpha-beta hydrolase superfamily lysophospholipase
MPLGLSWHTAVLLFGLVAFTPSRRGDFAPHPHAATSYAAAVARIALRQSAEDGIVAPGGRSVLLTHGYRTPRVVVLFHGLTDSPLQFLPFAQQLYDCGDNVYVPRLPHHAERSGSVAALARMTAEELRDLGDSTADVAGALGDTVVVAGLSAGANVAAWMGQNRNDVQRVILVAPALEVTHVPSLLHGAVLRLALRAPNVSRASPRDSTEPDRLPGWTTHAVAQTLRLGGAVRRAADGHPPAAREFSFLLNANDHTVARGPSLDLARQWSERGASVRVYELPDTLRLPHDVIDPRHPGSNAAAVYPVLAALVNGEQPAGGAREVFRRD